MAHIVTKKDGTRTPFKPERIKDSIVAAAGDAGLGQDQASQLASEAFDLVMTSFEGKEEVSSDEIREKILVELEILSPMVAEAWKKYEETKGI